MGIGSRQPLARYGGSLGFLRWSVLVLALVTLHLALMTTEHHTARGDAHHAGVADPGVMVATSAEGPLAPHGDHDTPRNTLSGCPAGVAILPLLLALLALAGYAFVRHAATPTRTATQLLALPCEPPPLAAPQRRALLQVFLI